MRSTMRGHGRAYLTVPDEGDLRASEGRSDLHTPDRTIQVVHGSRASCLAAIRSIPAPCRGPCREAEAGEGGAEVEEAGGGHHQGRGRACEGEAVEDEDARGREAHGAVEEEDEGGHGRVVHEEGVEVGEGVRDREDQGAWVRLVVVIMVMVMMMMLVVALATDTTIQRQKTVVAIELRTDKSPEAIGGKKAMRKTTMPFKPRDTIRPARPAL